MSLSSCGLFLSDNRHEVASGLNVELGLDLSSEDFAPFTDNIYDVLVRSIDANDNGETDCQHGVRIFGKTEHLDSFVSVPYAFSAVNMPADSNPCTRDHNVRFHVAMQLAWLFLKYAAAISAFRVRFASVERRENGIPAIADTVKSMEKRDAVMEKIEAGLPNDWVIQALRCSAAGLNGDELDIAEERVLRNYEMMVRYGRCFAEDPEGQQKLASCVNEHIAAIPDDQFNLRHVACVAQLVGHHEHAFHVMQFARIAAVNSAVAYVKCRRAVARMMEAPNRIHKNVSVLEYPVTSHFIECAHEMYAERGTKQEDMVHLMIYPCGQAGRKRKWLARTLPRPDNHKKPIFSWKCEPGEMRELPNGCKAFNWLAVNADEPEAHLVNLKKYHELELDIDPSCLDSCVYV